jgi:mRNA interferase MazF
VSIQGSHQVQRGDIWTLRFDPVIGHEQGGRRPGLVISSNLLHLIPSQLVIVVPISSRDRQVESHIPIQPPEGGLSRLSFALTEQLRTVSRDRLVRRLGRVEGETLDEVLKRVRWFLDL